MKSKPYLLNEVCNFIDYRGKTPPKTTSGIPLITAKIIKNGIIQPPQEYIARNYYDEWMRRGIPKKGSIVFTTEAPLGEVAQIRTSNKVAFAQRVIILEPHEDILHPDYLLYALQEATLKSRIEARATGTTVMGIKAAELKKVVIDLPPLEEQKRIASVLKSIDERALNNAEVNHNLEQQAQAIFMSWFVDFEPFGGKQPSEWQKGSLGDYVEIKRGGSPRPIQDFLSDSGLRWLKISDVTSLQTPFVLEIKEHIKESGLKKTVFLKSGALVLSNSATPGIPKILCVDTCIHDGWLYFPKSCFSNEFLYLFFKHIRQNLVALGNGSVFTNLKTDILKAYPVVVPDDASMRRFNDTVEPIFRGMENCTRESAKLATLRDSLLPRLMSGELDVSEVQF